MSEVTLFGFPRSTYAQMAGIVLTHKEVQYAFHDLETEMNTPSHIALHPFERVPILRHGSLTIYETSAIVSYVNDAFDGPNLTPSDPQRRAHMNQWISAVNAYYYPYLIYHVSHERNVFPQLGIASDEKVVAHAMPKVELCLQTLERELSRSEEFLIGPDLSLADFFMLPIIHAFGFAPEAQEMYPRFPSICTWRSGWKPYPQRSAFVPRSPRERRSSMPVGGSSSTDRNTEPSGDRRLPIRGCSSKLCVFRINGRANTRADRGGEDVSNEAAHL